MAIVNETMAERYWPGVSPIGKRVRFSDQELWREVVGVIDDVKHWGLDEPVNPELYVPSTQFPAWALTWVLLTNGDPLTLVPIAQRHVREIDANLPLFEVRTLGLFERLSASDAPSYLSGLMIGAEIAAALHRGSKAFTA